jgi:hypothetical protein
MIGVATLKALPWRLIGMIAGAAAIAFLLWRVSAWRSGYLERDQAVADLAAYKGSVAERDKQMAKDRQADEARRKLLTLKLADAENELQGLREKPITSVVYLEKIVNGHSCPDPRIGADWFGVWNDAADVATHAVSASD